VHDICTVISHIIHQAEAGRALPHRRYNLGGPERLSRVDMARAVAAHQGHNASCIRPVLSGSMNRWGGVCGPAALGLPACAC
jgi:hypothetical protein